MKKIVLQTMLVVAGAGVLSACQTAMPELEPRHAPTIVLGESQVLHIAAERTVCHSDRPMQCLVVKAEQGGAIFSVPYDAIVGFYPKVGMAYKIVARPQIDQTNGTKIGRWTLDEILAQEIVQ